MDPSRRARMLASQLSKGWKNCTEFLIAHVEDTEEWYFMIFGLPAPFDGEYLFLMKPPKDFPKSPPSFNFLTPNGLYGVNESICLSNGSYHANDAPGETGGHGWRPSEGMFGAAKEIVNGMLCPEALESGLGLYISTPREEREKLARESIGFNRAHYPEVCAGVDSICETQKYHPAVQQLLSSRRRRDIRSADTREEALYGELMAVTVYFGDGGRKAAAELLADPEWEKHVGLLGALGEAPRRRAVAIILAASEKGEFGPSLTPADSEYIEGYVPGAGRLIKQNEPLDPKIAAAILAAIAEENDIERRKTLTAAAEDAIRRA